MPVPDWYLSGTSLFLAPAFATRLARSVLVVVLAPGPTPLPARAIAAPSLVLHDLQSHRRFDGASCSSPSR